MIIQADKEGVEHIKVLCDVVLKAGGMQARELVNKVVGATTLTENKPCEEKPQKS